MTDDTTPDTLTAPETETPEMPENPDAPGTDSPEEAPVKLKQDVEIKDSGPCKKHIRVTIDRVMIEERISEKLKDYVKESHVPGFRPGKAPRKIVEKRFATDLSEQVKNEVLFASLNQLAEDHDIAPLTAPNINPFAIVLPKEGPLVYEFDVEVRPQFDLPEAGYRGLKIKKPVKTYTPADVTEEKRRLLAPAAQVVPKEDGVAELGDVITAELEILDGEKSLNKLPESNYRIEPRLAFKDAFIDNFGEVMKGARAGDVRKAEMVLSSMSADPRQAGKKFQANFHIKDIKTLRLPDLSPEMLGSLFGVQSEEQLDELIGVMLERRLEHLQRRSAREQVVAQLAGASEWQLPEDLLMRQARKSLMRRVMEMRADGIPEDEITTQQRVLQQDVVRNTAMALREHFVLQKVAEAEKIDVSDDDINNEIERLAEQQNESPRRLRARLEREELLDSLAAEMIERMALDLILQEAIYEEVPLDATATGDLATDVTSVEEQMLPGEMQDPTLLPPAMEATETTETTEKPAESAS